MSQRNVLRSGGSAAEKGVVDLVKEVETLYARVSNRDEDDFDDRETARNRLCSVLIQLHSPTVLRGVPFDERESRVFGVSCPSTREYFDSLGRDLRRIRAEALQEAVGCLETLVEMTSFAIEEWTHLGAVASVGHFESLPTTGIHVIKSCYQICADIG